MKEGRQVEVRIYSRAGMSIWEGNKVGKGGIGDDGSTQHGKTK